MANELNQCAGPFGALYDVYIDRPWLASPIGRLIWGIDVRPMYASMAALRTLPPGTTVVDVPSGGGVALRELVPGQDVRFIAVDASPAMLDRLRAKAAKRGLTQVETVEADMRALPLPDASADLVCSYSGLHMINAPETAIEEFVRVLKPGGRLLGSSFTETGARRKRQLFRAGERRGHAVPPRDGATLRRLLEGAGLRDVELDGDGFVVFSARRA